MNKRGFAHVRVGHAGAPHPELHLRKRSSCATGGFYTNPTTGMTIAAGSPVNISWDTSCMPNTPSVDIYLIAPSLPNSRIHEWSNVNFGLGSYQTTLEPKWWNDTSKVSLQFSIVPYGQQPFLSQLPAGPVFTATYSAPSSGSTPSDATLNSPNTVTYVNNFAPSSSLSKGRIAAGVLLPLLLIALGVYFWVRRSRAKGKEKRRRFSEAVDKRMSTISTDWKSITPAGATAAIRNSMAIPSPGSANRHSAFSFGPIRPLSTLAVEGDSASLGKVSMDSSLSAPQMSQLRPGIRASAYAERVSRVSRVSFATDVRPSSDSRRTTVTSRAWRTSALPPLPTAPIPTSKDTEVSPTQTSGPFSLTAEDIKARMAGNDDAEARPSMDEVWPSLSLMRTGNEKETGDDFLLPPRQSQAETSSVDLPLPPVPALSAPAPPVSPLSGFMPMSANPMSPDAMLRAYAERRIASPPPTTTTTSPIPFPSRTLSYNGSGMRSLYAPTVSDSVPSVAVHVTQTQTTDAEKRYTSYADMDPYAGI